MSTKKNAGFTLLEMLITVAVLSVLLALAVPYARNFLEIQRLKNAVETIAGDLQYARSESIKRNLAVSVTFTTTGATWSYTAAPSLWTTKNNAPFGGIRMNSVTFAGQSLLFEPVRGTANAGQILMTTSDNATQLRISVGILGQLSTCVVTSSSVGGYAPC